MNSTHARRVASCKTDWKVSLEQNRVAGIIDTQAYGALQRSNYMPLQIVGGAFQMGKTSENACLFLSTDNLCQIHNEKGGAAKPSVCQLYPFRLVNTPDGYFASLTFSCTSVLAGIGAPLREHEEHLKTLIAETRESELQQNMEQFQVSVTAERSLTWMEYLAFEATLLLTLQEVDPVDDLLWAASTIATQVGQEGPFHWKPSQLDPSSPLFCEVKDLFLFFMSQTAALLEFPKESGPREAFAESFLSRDTTPSRLLHGELPRFHWARGENVLTRTTITRYIKNLIWGKALISGPSLLTRILMLATSISIFFSYQKARTPLHTSRHFHFETLEWGLDLIESNLLTHSDDLEPAFLQFEKAILAFADIFAAAGQSDKVQ